MRLQIIHADCFVKIYLETKPSEQICPHCSASTRKIHDYRFQTIKSAIRKLEKEEIVYLEQGKGRNTILCLTEKGKKFSLEKIMPLHEIENKIWNEWTAEEQQQYLTLTKKYRDGLKKYLEVML